MQAVRQFRLKPVLIYTFLSAYAVFTIGSFLWIVLQSLKSNQEFLSTLPLELPRQWQWQNYADAWNRAKLGTFFVNSVIVSIASTLAGLALATLAAYALARIRKRYIPQLRQFFLIGTTVPTVLTVVPLYFFWVRLGLVNSKFGLVIIYAGMMLPFSIFYLTSYFMAIPGELEEAAAVDGATVMESFWHIFVPVALPGLSAVYVVNFLWAWNEFYYALLFLTRAVNFTIPMGLFTLAVNAEYSAQWVNLFAGMLIGTLPVLVLYLLLSEQITKALTSGAMKG